MVMDGRLRPGGRVPPTRQLADNAGKEGALVVRDAFGALLPATRVRVAYRHLPTAARVRIGVGRPPTTDPERVAAYVLGRFREPRSEVQELIERATDATERVVMGETELS